MKEVLLEDRKDLPPEKIDPIEIQFFREKLLKAIGGKGNLGRWIEQYGEALRRVINTLPPEERTPERIYQELHLDPYGKPERAEAA